MCGSWHIYIYFFFAPRLHFICIFKHHHALKLQLKRPREPSLDVSLCNSLHWFFLYYYCVTWWLACLYKWNKSPGRATAASSLRRLGSNLTCAHFHPWPRILTVTRNFQGTLVFFFLPHSGFETVLWCGNEGNHQRLLQSRFRGLRERPSNSSFVKWCWTFLRWQKNCIM